MMICECEPIEVSRDDRGIKWKCKRCGFSDVDKVGDYPLRIHRQCTQSLGRSVRLGDLVVLAIRLATSGRVHHGFGCEQYRRRMNAWGWRGCWQHRKEIWQRLTTEAAKEGYRLTWYNVPCYGAIATVNGVLELIGRGVMRCRSQSRQTSQATRTNGTKEAS